MDISFTTTPRLEALRQEVRDWLDAQDEATRNRHAAILREFGLD